MEIIEDFLKQNNFDKYNYCMELRDSFVSDYSDERISTLSLEEYNYTGKHDTFCYRLQYGLRDLSSMGNAFPGVYGVYIDSHSRININKRLSKKYGNDYKVVFDHMKAEILKLLKAGKEGDYSFIKTSEVNQQFRFKLLSVYYPENYFPVCTYPRAKGYCDSLGITIKPSDSMTDLNLKLVNWKEQNLPEDWSLYHAMIFCEWLGWNHKKMGKPFRTKDDGKELAEKIEKEIEDLHLVGEMKQAVINQRVNQGVFRNRLLEKEKCCKLCQVDNEQMLIASHIKPWRDCMPEERLDVNNGFLMCPNHDKLFDLGFISFDDSGNILISNCLTEINRIFLNVRENMKISVTEGNKRYLQYHRKVVFKK